jgi:hypothetical protein
MNIKDINQTIMFGTWSNDELTSIIDAVKWNRAQLIQATKRSLRLGDDVNFTNSITRQNVTGIVIKIATKYITVKSMQGSWRVPANMLSKVEESTLA